jgi:histone H3/H4
VIVNLIKESFSATFSYTPNKRIPPFVLANAEYVSHKEFGTPFCAFLHSSVTRSPSASSLYISCSVISSFYYNIFQKNKDKQSILGKSKFQHILIAFGKKRVYQRQTTQLLPSAPFYRTCPAEEVFLSCFRTSASAEEKYLRLSAADIYKELKKRNAAALRGFNPNHFAQVLIKMGVERKHTEYGNVYLVVRR